MSPTSFIRFRRRVTDVVQQASGFGGGVTDVADSDDMLPVKVGPAMGTGEGGERGPVKGRPVTKGRGPVKMGPVRKGPVMGTGSQEYKEWEGIHIEMIRFSQLQKQLRSQRSQVEEI
ncbi:unnamed protein product [Heligmosomoides polygyrus]|uniref:FoP_duplication domain-containing protein n=1 Tax=Heligmosomoides polygyrus TaxID=6339 RepID=A0A183GHX5_HELPZ|nr:unnamed protein product [Heligmosomoides polygyrus]